ncbi:MAG: alpha-L-rhamnosidase N-terminal domain-containing protein [Bacteroidota bacterium]
MKAGWQTALFDKSDWKAKWIMSSAPEDSIFQPSPVFRKEFSTAKKVASATAYITSQGLYEAFINGKRIGGRHSYSWLDKLQSAPSVSTVRRDFTIGSR